MSWAASHQAHPVSPLRATLSLQIAGGQYEVRGSVHFGGDGRTQPYESTVTHHEAWLYAHPGEWVEVHWDLFVAWYAEWEVLTLEGAEAHVLDRLVDAARRAA